MRLADAVAEIDLMRIARPSAIPKILAVAQRVREHAMLHVKHRHVLMDDGFKTGRREALQHRGELLPVEIVAGDHAGDAVLFKNGGGYFIGDVQGVIRDEGNLRRVLLEEREAGKVADEDRIGLAIGDLL